jgi:tetratricopeptide (TPR) repeat protein
MLEDGIPPPSSAVIQRVCNGTAHAEGYTDGQGYFSVQLGQDSAMMGDASESLSGFGRTFPSVSGGGNGGAGSGTGGGHGFGQTNRQANCELRAQLGGYRSQTVSLADHGPLDNPDVGIILLHRLGAAESTTVTASTLTAPKPARKAFQKGMDLSRKKRPEEAMASFRDAVKLDPQFAAAWCELGKLQADRGQAAEAHQSFDAAGKAEPRWPEPFLELSLLELHARNWQELADVTAHVLRLNSFDYPQAFFFNAVANFNLRHMEAAEKSVRSAERLDTQHRYPQTAHLLATILANRREWAAAADELRNYLVLAPHADDAPKVRRELDQMERLALQSDALARKDGQ